MRWPISVPKIRKYREVFTAAGNTVCGQMRMKR